MGLKFVDRMMGLSVMVFCVIVGRGISVVSVIRCFMVIFGLWDVRVCGC